jgi:two-component system, chemotaxis family, chemotaxis protein CheY
MKILVVDDSSVVREMIRRTIAASGLAVSAVREAGDGRAAIRSLAEHGADLLITDINMPGMGGVELVRAVRQDRELAALPVLVVSTDGSPARRQMMTDLGVVGYLSKPFRPEELHRHLRGLCGGGA